MNIKKCNNKSVVFFSLIVALLNLGVASAGEDFEVPICQVGFGCSIHPPGVVIIIDNPNPPTPTPPISTPLPGETKVQCLARINNDISVCVGLTDTYLNSRGCRKLSRILPSWGSPCFAALHGSQVPVKAISWCSAEGKAKKAQQCQ